MAPHNLSQNTDDWHPLDCFFAPRAVAVIGASERPGSVGRAVFWNLISSPFGGTVYAINPHHERVLGIRTLSSVKEAPEPVDLALIIVPASGVPTALDACIEAGVRAAIIISADIAESGEPRHILENDIRERTLSGALRIIGPNSLGIMNPVRGLNAAYATRIALKGNVGFISQSGAVSAAILDWSFHVKMGFSAFVSFGAMVDVGWSDLIYYLGSDPNTKSIVIYMESLGDARSFLSAAREVALTKPIILLKTGQTSAGAAAARTSTYFDTSDTADDDVLSAALLRSGVLRVNDTDTLFSMAEVLGKQPRPKGPRLTIISNAAGPAVLATDALVNAGGEPACLSEATMRELNESLPPYWNKSNPIDLVADADPERYVNAVTCAVRDTNSDGVLVLLAPQVMSDPTGTARALAQITDWGNKPVLAAWMGGDVVAEGASLLNEHLIPVFPYPDQAARIFAAMWRYSYAVRGLYETPEPEYEDKSDGDDRATLSRMVKATRDAGQSFLSDTQTKRLLFAYGIPVIATRIVCNEDEAVSAAEAFGYPVVLYPDARPSDSDAPRELTNASEVRTCYRRLREADKADLVLRPCVQNTAYHLTLGARTDPQFGPYIFVQSGGQMGAVYGDSAYALPPLNTTLARRTLERTTIYKALAGRREGSQADLALLDQVVVRFSHLILAERLIRELEIKPLLVAPGGIRALEARAILHDPALPVDSIPQPAIRPYPVEYVTTCTLKNGMTLTMRPIRPEDETLMVKFHRTLSSETVYFRYLRLLSLDQRIRHDRMSQMCCIDYDRQIALVAECVDPDTKESSILAIGRLVRIHGTHAGDFALVVNDSMQGHGLGKKLLSHLLHVAAAERLAIVVGIIHPENKAMLQLCGKLGFKLSKAEGDDVRAEYRTQP